MIYYSFLNGSRIAHRKLGIDNDGNDAQSKKKNKNKQEWTRDKIALFAYAFFELLMTHDQTCQIITDTIQAMNVIILVNF